MNREQRRGIAAAILAAFAFALTIPITKWAFQAINPWLLAGLFYLGSGVGLTGLSALRLRQWSVPRRDLGRLVGAIVSGGIVAPVLLLFGLREVTGSTASLLLTCEAAFTSLMAWLVFREHVDRRILFGFIAITGGALILTVAPGLSGSATLVGVSLILAACLGWAIDNNLTRTVSLADPMQLAAIKGLAAGVTNTVLAGVAGAAWPTLAHVAAATAVGFVGYGLSLALFIYALRELGTARTAAYFGVAPFFAASMSLLLLDEPLSWSLAAAGILMAVGVWLHVTERHSHEHVHEALEHEHAHEHDIHHDHHDGEAPSGRHTHRHVHRPLRHSHPHFPDAHHRHDH